MIVKGYVYTYLYLLLVFGISYIINKKSNALISRKFIHIAPSFCFIIFYKYLRNSFHLLVVPLTIIIFNYVSYKKKLLKPMEEESSLGTVYYAVSIFIFGLITYLNNNFYCYFGIGWFIMAFADGAAPIIGKYIKSPKIYKDKTLNGSLTVFGVAVVVCVIFNVIFNIGYSVFDIIIIGISSFILELIGVKGFDNITLPLGVAFISYLLGGF